MEHHVTLFYISALSPHYLNAVSIQSDSRVLVRAQSFQGSKPSCYSVLIDKCWNCFAPILSKINSTAIELFCASDKFNH